MRRLGKKIIILFGIFIAAVVIYFIWEQKTEQPADSTVYTSMEEATLPVVYTAMYGRKMNLLHGYKQDMGQAAIRDALTVLPEDRALPVTIADCADHIEGISYEVRSLDLDRLVERTEVTDWKQEDTGAAVTLPIQNLLAKNKEYLLILSLVTPEYGQVRYYTRILWTDNENAADMIDFAVDFTNKTFDYDAARELTTYLETDSSEDNSSLSHVTIRSSFSQLTWAGLAMKIVGDVRVTLKDLDGIMCSVSVEYEAEQADEEGNTELYEVEDNYTMKWDSRRIYLMDFDRRTNQVFSGSRDLFSGKRILLGIQNEDVVSTVTSGDGTNTACVVNRDLWSYNEKTHNAVKVFSFRSGKDDGLRDAYRNHDIRVLSVSDDGSVAFLVYGYMNRGPHEGYVGAALYQYDSGENGIEERFFTPAAVPFEMLEDEVDQLAYLGSSGMLYLMADHAVYGIDLNSREYMVLADSLTEGNYAVSASKRHFAWKDGSDPYGTGVIHLMDLDSGTKQEIGGEEGIICRTLGFVGDDFVYGMAREGDEWVYHGRGMDLPMYQLRIMDDGGNIVNEYAPEDAYIAHVTVEESRIHMDRITRTGSNSYVMQKKDTIVCNRQVETDHLAGIGWYASEDRRKLYFVQLNTETVSRDVRVSVPRKASYDKAETVELKANYRNKEEMYYAYGGGHYLGGSRSFAEALALAYDRMGTVTDHNRNIIWNRVNRQPVKNIKDPVRTGAPLIRHMEDFNGSGQYEDEILLLDARGCTLSQVLYFIGQGCPVAAYVDEDHYLLISGYDQYNVTVYDPAAGETRKMGLNDAGTYFDNLGNDFICGVFMD